MSYIDPSLPADQYYPGFVFRGGRIVRWGSLKGKKLDRFIEREARRFGISADYLHANWRIEPHPDDGPGMTPFIVIKLPYRLFGY